MAGMHIAARGSRAGQLVPCKAASPETCGLTNAEHYPDEEAYSRTLAENNDTLARPVSRSNSLDPAERLESLRKEAQKESEVQLKKMMKKYPEDRAAFLRAMDAAFANAYSSWMDEKMKQDHPPIKHTAAPGNFLEGVRDATASAMSEGFKIAHRKNLQESFSESVRDVLGTYWDENRPK